MTDESRWAVRETRRTDGATRITPMANYQSARTCVETDERLAQSIPYLRGFALEIISTDDTTWRHLLDRPAPEWVMWTMNAPEAPNVDSITTPEGELMAETTEHAPDPWACPTCGIQITTVRIQGTYPKTAPHLVTAQPCGHQLTEEHWAGMDRNPVAGNEEERFYERGVPYWVWELYHRARNNPGVRPVLELHYPTGMPERHDCLGCNPNDRYPTQWPCKTIKVAAEGLGYLTEDT